MKKVLLMGACIIALMSGCGQGKPTETTNETANELDEKHTADYISQRLKDIYSHFRYVPYDDNVFFQAGPNYDSLFCSQDYLRVYNEAEELSMKSGYLFMDADHWIMGQDMDENWSYKVYSISDITDSTATAKMLINNFDEQTVELRLVFERDDWFVDNFLTGNDEATYDEKKNMEEFVRSVKMELEP